MFAGGARRAPKAEIERGGRSPSRRDQGGLGRPSVASVRVPVPFRGFFPVRAVHELHRAIELGERNRLVAGEPASQLASGHVQPLSERFLGSAHAERLAQYEELKDERAPH